MTNVAPTLSKDVFMLQYYAAMRELSYSAIRSTGRRRYSGSRAVAVRRNPGREATLAIRRFAGILEACLRYWRRLLAQLCRWRGSPTRTIRADGLHLLQQGPA